MSATQVGQKLREAREARKLSLSEASKATHIRSYTLQALEDGDFGQLPSAAQVRGILRSYAAYLELDPEALFALLRPEPEPQPEDAPDAAAAPAPPAKPAKPAPVEIPEPAKAVPAAFTAIGDELRQRRQNLDLSLAEIESSTHIPEHYLRRLESGDFDSFPSPSQARGMLANYADFVGLESEGLLLRYAEALQERLSAKRPAVAAGQPGPGGDRRMVLRLPLWVTSLFSRDLLLGGVTGLLLLIFVIWSIGRVAALRAGEEPEPTAPPLTDLLLGSPVSDSGSAPAGTPESINLLGEATATPGLIGEATIEIGGNLGSISLRLITSQRTYLQISVDGEVQFDGRTRPGQTYTYSALNQISLKTGNASALRAFLNDQDLGILGIYGEVVTLVFTREGAATPTLSPTPTIDPAILTATADFLLTPSPTPTETPSFTPEPTEDTSP